MSDDRVLTYDEAKQYEADMRNIIKGLEFPSNLNDSLSFKNDKGDQKSCPQPEDPPMKDSVANMEDILKQAGADQQCVKESDFYSQNSSGSMRAEAEALFARMGAEAKWAQSTMSNKNKQVGCGTLLVKATNIIQKQKAMQCIINQSSQNTNVMVTANAKIQIKTLPLSLEQSQNMAKIQSDYLNLEERTQTKFVEQIARLATIPNVNQNVVQSMIDFQEKVNDSRILALEKLLQPYDRSITIVDSRISSTAEAKALVQVSLSEDAQNKLAVLSEGISKDVAELSVSNTLGVNAQDTSVKDVVNKNINQSSSSASSSIKETAQNTKATLGANSEIIIECPGRIDISRTVIDSNAVANIMLSQMMQNAIANGLDIAAKTLSDDQNVKKILNEAKGLDEQQKAINEALKVGTENTLFQNSGSSGSMMIVGIVLVILLILGGVLYLLFGGKGGSGTNIIIPQYKFDAKDPKNVLFVMMGVFFLLFLFAIAVMRPKSEYQKMKKYCEEQGSRLCSSSEVCDKVKSVMTNGVQYSPVSDGDNNWVQYNNGLCKQHLQSPPNDQRLASMCCPVHGPSPSPSTNPKKL
jgi:hypothetical protein